jgi:hypothetical protein
MALRMLRYVVRQLEHWRQEHPGSALLPVIIPLVLYHGPGGGWSAPRRVEELFDVPDKGEHPEHWSALVPHFQYLVDDLTTARAEALMARPGPPLVRLALLVLRYGRTQELPQRLPEWKPLFAQVSSSPDGFVEFSMVLRYLLWVGGQAAQEATAGMLHSVMGPQRLEELMSDWDAQYFNPWRQQGRLEGLEAGRAQGRAEAVLRILTARGIPVDKDVQQLILSCTDLPTLDQWFDRALKATRVSDVITDLEQ